MNVLIQEIKKVFARPRLLVQYIVLNFFLVSVGGAAVVYIKKEALVSYQVQQNEMIVSLIKALDSVNLPVTVEQKVNNLEQSAEVKPGQTKDTEPPKK